MNFLTSMPPAPRWLLLVLLGLVAGRLVSWFAWWLVHIQRFPGQALEADRQPKKANSLGWRACCPLVGAWRLRRKDEALRAPTGWRPLAVEIGLSILLPTLHGWEIERWGLVRALAPAGFVPGAADQALLHLQFASQVVLILWMLVASLVDFDEQTIPDLVTVPCTLLGILIAAVWPGSLLPIVTVNNGAANVSFLTLASPADWPANFAARSVWPALVLALACYLAWCLALLPWLWRPRRGWSAALRLLIARWALDPASKLVALIAACGSVGIAATWWVGGDHWRGLLSALVGMAAGGALMWSTRIAASWAVGREAMGFGDVTLLAMIGSFLGWQAVPMVFFLAPLAGVFLGLVQWFAYRENVLPFGPFLCLAALAVIVAWGALWRWAEQMYGLPWLVPGAMAVSLAAMAVLLRLWRGLRERLSPPA